MPGAGNPPTAEYAADSFRVMPAALIISPLLTPASSPREHLVDRHGPRFGPSGVLNQRVEREALLAIQHANGVDAAGILAAGIHVDRKVLLLGLFAPAAENG